MKKVLHISLTIMVFLLAGAAVAHAQDDGQNRGSIRGAVYEDVNGDGVCVNTGVAGENPVVGVDLEFVSSDESTVVNLYTGSDGTFGLVAAGQSIWRVTVKPDTTKWVVTSENPKYVPVLEDSGLVQTGVNFCVQRGGAGNAVIILPQSGAPAQASSGWLLVTAVFGFGLFAAGAVLELKRRLI